MPQPQPRLSLPLWQERFAAPPLPMTAAEVRARGWDAVDVVFVTGTNVEFPPLPRHILERSLQTDQPDAFTNHPYWTREFVGAGPYRLVRHPVYTGLALHFAGACLATGNLLLVAGTLLVTYPALYARASAEERLLRAHFGAAYDAYAREVGMLVPLL